MGSRTKHFNRSRQTKPSFILDPTRGPRGKQCRWETAGTALFLFWQTERERLLKRLCNIIENAKRRGEPVERCCRRLARAWQGKRYKSGKVVRLSARRLQNLFYARRAGGDEALKLQYRARASHGKARAALLRKVANSETFSLLAALRRLWRDDPRTRDLIRNEAAVYRLFGPRERAALRVEFTRRNGNERAERRFAKLITAMKGGAPE